MATPEAPAPGSVTMFSTSWCGYCNRLKAQMGREGIAFTEVDIEQEPEAVQFVMEVNGGNQTVPTLLFPDGSPRPTPRSTRSRSASPPEAGCSLASGQRAGRSSPSQCSSRRLEIDSREDDGERAVVHRGAQLARG